MANNINDPQARISAKECIATATKIKKYPADLSESTVNNVTSIKIFEYTKKDILDIEKKAPLGSIFFPLASNMSYMDGHDWKEFDGGVLQNIADGGAGDIKSIAETVGGIGAVFGKSVVEKLGNGSSDKAFDIVQAETGVSLNPKRSNVYVSPKFREFQLEYTFVARNAQDSKNIKDIENILRYYSSPENAFTKGQFLRAPALFLVKHISSDGTQYVENEYLPKYLPAALVGISVDYNSNGDNYLHRNTFAPIDVKMTLAFKELEYDTKDTLRIRYNISDDNLWDSN